ncbi:phage tail sheath subtilisin-like domain-containing protein [Variovorax sp. dw_954]|uniref:phage tail sheath family protein n=1 Tax=Variovorax sp. dw_954 TaxID=2720078 RepID=UPI001BD59AB8
MPPTLSYPGVYVQELPSNQHTITGVATSIAAFIGWAPQGPADEAVMVHSMSEYQATYGGFVTGVYLAYAVSHFFQNGGQQAYIVRVLDAATAKNSSTIWPDGTGNVTLWASSPGQWGDSLKLTITLASANRFSLLVQLAGPNNQMTTLESYSDLSVTTTDPRYFVNVIDSDSDYLTFIPPGGTQVPIAPLAPAANAPPNYLTFANGNAGTQLYPGDPGMAFEALVTVMPPSPAISALSTVTFDLLCVPGETDKATLGGLQNFCFSNRAFLIVDAPQFATQKLLLQNGPYGTNGAATTPLAGASSHASYSAYYFPWVLAPDPAAGGRTAAFPPSGAVAGLYASTDTNRGVWKAPAGIATSLSQVLGPTVSLNDALQGDLNPLAVNCLRTFRTSGTVIWGARTLDGADALGSQWKYVPVRRLALYIESSLYVGTQWIVFEPNDEPLWGQIRMSVGTFMQGLFLQGAFAGTTRQAAYFVKCDGENNPASSVALGVVNILVGFAPLDPAEFVVIQIQQIAGQTS